MWLEKAQDLKSKGQLAPKAKRLADLHARRTITQGQFFTPGWIASGIWSSIAGIFNSGSRMSVLDTSVGTGRLLNPAPVDKCDFYGFDVDDECISALAQAAEEADAIYDFREGSLGAAKVSGFDIAVINPPFGLTIEDPTLEAFDCTGYGLYGPNSSAKSHEYALAQALDAAKYVAAILPASMIDTCKQSDRLHTIVQLGSKAFLEEGANVRTIVAFFDRREVRNGVCEVRLNEGDTWPLLALSEHKNRATSARMRFATYDQSVDVIDRPVTGNNTVELHHRRRNLVLKFHCGLTESKVMNGLLVSDVEQYERHRYPKGISYVGSGKFFLDSYIIQENPERAFCDLLDNIAALGGRPVVSPTLSGYFTKLIKKHRRAIAPFRKVVKTTGNCTVQVTAKRSAMLVPGDFNSPAIKKGQVLDAELVDGDFILSFAGTSTQLRKDELLKRFTVDTETSHDGAKWTVIHEGLCESFPEQFTSALARIDAAGIDWLWPYQRNSLAELLVKPYGSIAGWIQGTGKARLTLALALLSGKGLVCLESGLVAEMLREVEKVGLKDKTKLIKCPKDTLELNAINIVSYNSLRSRWGKRTLASYLRNRVHTLVSDEGSLLRNVATQQSRAVSQVNARRLYVLDGTPHKNFARDLLPLAAVTTGHGLAHQRYGVGNKHALTPRLLDSANRSVRGIQAFSDKHVVLEWVTNQFKEQLQEGAKREVPRINNVGAFRDWTAPFLQRRVRHEPEVAPYAGCPEPTYKSFNVEWDDDHFMHYLKTCIEFADFYRRHKEEQEAAGRNINLTLILARIQAVQRAAGCPHSPGKNSPGIYNAVTSKQRFVLERALHHKNAGRKSIVYAATPAAVERLCELMKDAGLKVVMFHGGITIESRIKELDEQFRFGDADVLVSSWCGQKGLNIEQAKAVILYDRDWSSSTEEQAEARPQRPSQKDSIFIEYCHLEGSIDSYMEQVQRFKRASADSGLDWGEGLDEDEEYLHLDTILGEFVQGIYGLSTFETARLLGVA